MPLAGGLTTPARLDGSVGQLELSLDDLGGHGASPAEGSVSVVARTLSVHGDISRIGNEIGKSGEYSPVFF